MDDEIQDASRGSRPPESESTKRYLPCPFSGGESALTESAVRPPSSNARPADILRRPYASRKHWRTLNSLDSCRRARLLRRASIGPGCLTPPGAVSKSGARYHPPGDAATRRRRARSHTAARGTHQRSSRALLPSARTLETFAIHHRPFVAYRCTTHLYMTASDFFSKGDRGLASPSCDLINCDALASLSVLRSLLISVSPRSFVNRMRPHLGPAFEYILNPSHSAVPEQVPNGPYISIRHRTPILFRPDSITRSTGRAASNISHGNGSPYPKIRASRSQDDTPAHR